MPARGRALMVSFAALLLTAAPLWAAREAEPPPPWPAPALFSADDPARILLVRVYAATARDNEFVEIANPSAESMDVAGWSLTDREASSTFPVDSVLEGGAHLVVTRNATSYAEDTLARADFTFDRGEARRMEGGVLRLADAGDEILLLDPAGSVVDAYAWGTSSYEGPGWTGRAAERMGRGEIAVRVHSDEGTWIDRDAAEDWESLRRHRLGQSAFAFESFDRIGPVTAVLSPDDGDAPLLRFFASARKSIDVSVYTLTSVRIASSLADAASRGVRVRVLLDGGPVGGIEEDAHRIVGGLVAAGVDVRWLVSGTDLVKRYRFLHAKYAVVDARAAWIGSENFGEAGFPESRRGNRGWSVVIEAAEVASALSRVFEVDFDARRRDSRAAHEPTWTALPPAPSVPTWASVERSEVRRARLVLAPDQTLEPDGLLDFFDSAIERLSIEAFYLEDLWRDAPNPFLEAAFAAAHRGVAVHILLDGSWTSVEADSGMNDEILTRINGRAKNESVPLEVRLLEPRGSVERLHNKGAVVDGHVVLVSSMNWALGSATENREVGVLLEDADLARRFEAAFDADWDGRATSAADAEVLDDPRILLGLYVFVAVVSAVSLRKLRVGAKGIKPRAQVRARASLGADLRRGRGEVRLLPAELVAEPRPRSGRGTGTPRGGEEARGRLGGPEGD